MLILMIVYVLSGLFFLSDKSDGKRKKAAGSLLFGGLWLLNDKDANRDLTKTEIYGFIIVITLIIGALLFNSY